MTTTTNDRYARLAGLHRAIAVYCNAKAVGVAPLTLQDLWHRGFESYGSAFADAITQIEEGD